MDNDPRSQLVHPQDDLLSPALTGKTVDSILQRILSCSMEYLGQIPPSKFFSGQENARIHSISLPEPPTLLSTLVKVGAPISVAEEMECAYQQRATELKKRYETAAFQATFALSQGPGSSTSPSLQPKLFAAIKKLYVTRLEHWQKACLSLYKSHSAMSTGKGNRSQRGRGAQTMFNTEYVPLLEHFFTENPFPTHSEKALLAKKSGMSYRQIHVWFQNKRTRSRKEGKGFRRKTILNGTTFPVGPQCDVTKQSVKQNDIRSRQSQSRGEDMISFDAQGPLDALALPHVFPCTYPPPPRYKPFPEISVLQSHLLPWRRRPSSMRSLSPQATGMSDLVDLFSQFTVRDDHDDRSQSVHSARTEEIGAAVASITIKPFSAPLFAIRRPVAFVTKATLIPFPTVPAPRTLLHPFRTPCPQAQPVTLMHSGIQKTCNNGRKVAPLPKRVPQVSMKSKRNQTHPISDYSSHRSLSAGSISSTESSPSVSATPEVGSPRSLPLPDDVSSAPESRISEGLRLDPLSLSYRTHGATSTPQGNSNAIMRVMQGVVPPPHARLPLCVGS